MGRVDPASSRANELNELSVSSEKRKNAEGQRKRCSVKIKRWFEWFAPAAVMGGIGCLLADNDLPQLLGMPTTVAGVSLLLVGCCAGLVQYIALRRSTRALLRQAVELSQRTGRASQLTPTEDMLGEMVRAFNDAMGSSERCASEAVAATKEMQVQLKVATSQRRQAEAIIHSIDDAVLVTDRYDEVILANESASKSLGFESAEALRRPVDRVINDNQLVGMIRDVRQGKGANERRVFEHRVRRAGQDRIFKVTLSNIRDNTGESGGVVSVLHDSTREIEIAKMKNDFVSSVSHELRTPLASVRAYVEMLIDGEANDDKTRREFYDIIMAEAVRLGRLIDNILNISRIESGLVEIKRVPVSLTVICKEALDVIIPQAKMKDIKVEEHLEPAFYQTLADKDMLYQAILNLLSNAVKYTPNGGTVTLRTSVDETDKKVVVRIIDSGVGIPQKDLPFVFDKFFRVEANKNVAKGTGLGLSLVKNIIETVHKGKMMVSSEQGKGSSFGFVLDLC
jgi:two-component system, OmpR family, phosphate regulon sensor histidine kinase PhoR